MEREHVPREQRSMRALTLALAFTVVVLARAARAATFVVNNTAATTSGLCGTTPGGCTLPDAIAAANSTPGRDTIVFDPSVFPPGSDTIIPVIALPVVADPAGTVIDGAGASVIIEGGPLTGLVLPPGSGRGAPVPIDGLVIASAPGIPLSKPMVANLTVHGFSGRGILICGGSTGTFCGEDVSGAVVQNVVVAGNGSSGLEIDGDTVMKTRVIETVATGNGDLGMRVAGATAVVDARIHGATARGNHRFGVGIVAPSVAGALVTDTVAANNTADGIEVNGAQSITKTKIMRVAVSRNGSSGVDVFGPGSATGTTIANVVAAGNTGGGIVIDVGDFSLARRSKTSSRIRTFTASSSARRRSSPA
jgi:hypothetical protein